MNRQERADKIAAILDREFPNPPVPLDHASHFELLVAVLLSAQCTDERVNQVTPQLFALANTPAAMAALPVATVQGCIKSCGLAPAKAKNIVGLSALLLQRHQGNVPADLQALEALPGVGHKTASVVMAQGFGVPAFPVDTHIHRLAGRWQLSKATNVVQVERDLKAVFAPETWNVRHLQIIFFGRAFCPARGHVVEQCPICRWAMSKTRARAEATQGVSKPRRSAARPTSSKR